MYIKYFHYKSLSIKVCKIVKIIGKINFVFVCQGEYEVKSRGRKRDKIYGWNKEKSFSPKNGRKILRKRRSALFPSYLHSTYFDFLFHLPDSPPSDFDFDFDSDYFGFRRGRPILEGLRSFEHSEKLKTWDLEYERNERTREREPNFALSFSTF